jgi:REP element-mobilizing transposase RayT
MYFVTVCAAERRSIFGEIRDGTMFLNRWGELVREEWLRTAEMRPDVELDEFVVMPNHFHGIIIFTHVAMVGDGSTLVPVGAHCVRPPSDSPATNSGGARSAPLQRAARSLGSVMAGFKAAVTRRIGQPVWQRNYFEHIIRHDHGLNRLRDYIIGNPSCWLADRENPNRQGVDECEQWLATGLSV